MTGVGGVRAYSLAARAEACWWRTALLLGRRPRGVAVVSILGGRRAKAEAGRDGVSERGACAAGAARRAVRGAEAQEEDQGVEKALRRAEEGCRLGLLLRHAQQGLALVCHRDRAAGRRAAQRGVRVLPCAARARHRRGRHGHRQGHKGAAAARLPQRH